MTILQFNDKLESLLKQDDLEDVNIRVKVQNLEESDKLLKLCKKHRFEVVALSSTVFRLVRKIGGGK